MALTVDPFPPIIPGIPNPAGPASPAIKVLCKKFPTNPVCHPLDTAKDTITNAASNVAGNAAGWAWDHIVQSFVDANINALQLLVTSWTKVSSPDLGGENCRLDQMSPAQAQAPCSTATGSAEVVHLLANSTNRYVIALSIAAIFIGAARIALTQQGKAAGELAQALGRLLFTCTVGLPLIHASLWIGDNYTQWIIGRSLYENKFQNAGAAFTAIAVMGNPVAAGLAQSLVFIVALFGIIGVIVQLALMLLRIGIITMLVGLWPLSASFSNTDTGRQWWTRTNGWLLAFVLYKPAAATVYAAAFTLVKGRDGTSMLAGMFMIVLATLTLPALMRLCVPAVASASAGGSGAGAAMVGSVATGALMVGKLMSESGGGGQASPSGSAGSPQGPPDGPSGAKPSGPPGGGPQGSPTPGPGSSPGGTPPPVTGEPVSTGVLMTAQKTGELVATGMQKTAETASSMSDDVAGGSK